MEGGEGKFQKMFNCSETLNISSYRLGEIIEGLFADMCAHVDGVIAEATSQSSHHIRLLNSHQGGQFL